jgi:hypothetical protein
VKSGAWRYSAWAFGVAVISSGAAAQWAPTRMQMCEAELASVTGDARKKTMGECLRRRLEGEKIVERDCKRQVREVAVELSGNSKQDMQRQCVRTALQASFTELPRRPAPAPKPEGGAVLVATDGTNTPLPVGPAGAQSAAAPTATPAQATAAAPGQ